MFPVKPLFSRDAMQKIVLALVLVVGAAIGLLWPGGRHDGARVEAGKLQPTEVTLTRSSDGHFYTDAQVNGVTIRFLIDTGAGAIALSPQDAKRVGIAFDEGHFELIGEGASGLVRGTFVTLDSLEVIGLRSEKIQAAIVAGTNTSLLGQPFLRELDEIVIRKDQMLLRQQG
jgi:aspartyl protease family protein